MQLFLLGFGLLLFVGAWRLMLRKTILDHYRDKLFDLRDELRCTYIERGWDMSTPTYEHLRLLANGYLRSTERFSFFTELVFATRVLARPSLANGVKAEFEQHFAVQDEALKRFVSSYRRRALDIMFGYMINGSMLMFFSFCVLSAFAAVYSFLRSAHQGAFKWSRRIFAQRFLSGDLLEEYSYRLGTEFTRAQAYRPVA